MLRDGRLEATGQGRRRRGTRGGVVLALLLVASVLSQVTPARAQTAAADLALSASVSPAEPHFNELITFAFTLTNQGPDAAANAVVSGTVPAGVQLRSLSCPGGTGNLSGSGPRDFSCTYASVAAGDSTTATVRVDADVLGELAVPAEATADTGDPALADNSATAAAHVRPADADIGVALSARATAAVGDQLTYRFTVFNNGPEDVKEASATVLLPPAVSGPSSFVFPGGAGTCVEPGATVCFLTVPAARPSMRCWYPGAGGAHSVTCRIRDGGLIGPGGFGGTSQFTEMRVEAQQTGTATAEAHTEAMTGIADGNAANDTRTADTLIVAPGEVDLGITKTAPAEVLVGQAFDYLVTVRNHGPSEATGVTVTDALPAGVSLVSVTPDSGVTCTGTTTLSCDVGTLGANLSRQVRVRVTADAEGTVGNTASVSSAEPDPDPSDNDSTVNVLVRQAAADVSVTVTGPAGQETSRPFTVSMNVRNDGPEATSNVRVHGTLPSGVTLTSSGNSDCFSSASGFQCFVGSLINGQSDFLQVRLESSTVGTVQIPIAVTQSVPDPDPSNNEPVYEIEIVPRPEADLGVALALPDEIDLGETFSYQVLVTNNGPDPARVLLNSAMHADAFADESASSTTGPCSISHGSGTLLGESAAIVICSIDPLAPGDTWTVTVELRAVEGGSQPVSGTVSGSILDPVGTNNSVLGAIEVIDNRPPAIATTAVAAHIDEGSAASATGTVSDPDGDALTLTASLGSVTDNGDGTWSWSHVPADGPAGPQAVTITAADPGGEQDSVSFDLVIDDVAPTIALSGAVAVDEADTYTLTLGGVTDPGDDTVTEWIVDWGDGTVESHATGGDVTHVYADGPADRTITVDLVDEDGTHAAAGTLNVAVANVAPHVGVVAAPVDPVLIGSAVAVSAPFSDPGDDTHSAVWDWGDGSTSAGEVDQAAGTVSGSHAYPAPGVYTVSVTVTDDDGGSGQAAFEFVVVYDPDGGFVTGGGSVHSPEGAYTPDPSLSGRATFGFVSRYKKGATVPSGNTQFQFKAASFSFRSTSYEWLVISGATARFKGTGTVGDEGDYGFMLDATDGQAGGGGGEDRFRIKIWDRATGETVYDNVAGDPGDDVVDGSIVVHKG